jgi:hypothetical protein
MRNFQRLLPGTLSNLFCHYDYFHFIYNDLITSAGKYDRIYDNFCQVRRRSYFNVFSSTVDSQSAVGSAGPSSATPSVTPSAANLEHPTSAHRPTNTAASRITSAQFTLKSKGSYECIHCSRIVSASSVTRLRSHFDSNAHDLRTCSRIPTHILAAVSQESHEAEAKRLKRNGDNQAVTNTFKPVPKATLEGFECALGILFFEHNIPFVHVESSHLRELISIARRLHSGIHTIGYILDPEFMNTAVYGQLENQELMVEWHALMATHLPGINTVLDLSTFHSMSISFALCTNDDFKRDALSFWTYYGSSSPNLRKLAMRVFAQPVTSSAAERNWSLFSWTFGLRQTCLTADTIKKLIEVKVNSLLQQRRLRTTSDTLLPMWITDEIDKYAAEDVEPLLNFDHHVDDDADSIRLYNISCVCMRFVKRYRTFQHCLLQINIICDCMKI